MSEPRGVRRWAAVGLFAVVASAAAAEPDVIPPDRFRPKLEELRAADLSISPDMMRLARQLADEVRRSDPQKAADPQWVTDQLRKRFGPNGPPPDLLKQLARPGAVMPPDGRPPVDPTVPPPNIDEPRSDLVPEPDGDRPATTQPPDGPLPGGLDLPGVSAQLQRRREQDRAMLALTQAWEKTFGPLDNNPALKKALMDLVRAGEDVHGPDGENLWQFLEQQAGGADGLGDWLNGLDAGGDWKFPALDLPSWGKFDWGNESAAAGPRPAGGPAPSAGGSDGPSLFGFSWPGGDSWAPVILLAAILLGALFYWRYVYAPDPLAAEGPGGWAVGPWPVDPRRLASRADVVKAFEHVALLRYGADARVWNHRTIADALAADPTDPSTADLFARLYALARYSPGAERLTPADLDEARRVACRLAGVSA